MFAGPIIAREVRTSPRSLRFYAMRTAYVGLLFILMWTAWQSLIGWQEVRDVGVLARFGNILYLLFAVLQLTLMLFFAPLSSASAVAHEKDRRTFVLLLMTDLSDLEIVVGKLVASLLQIFLMLAAAVPVMSLCALLGGISFLQVANLFAVTAASGLAGGALGLLVALWRDRTFQSIALTILMVVLSIVGVETIDYAFPDFQIGGVKIVEVLNPYRALLAVLNPTHDQLGQVRTSSFYYIAVRCLFALLLVAFGTVMLRKWNPGRNEPREQREEGELEAIETIVEVAEVEHAAPVAVGAGAAVGGSNLPPLRSGAATSVAAAVGGNGAGNGAPNQDLTTGLHVPRRTHRRLAPLPKPYRRPWNNPIIWREVRTRAYGTKPIIIKAIYVLLFALGVAYFYANPDLKADPWRPSWVLGFVGILSLILVNAQGVTALTSERDSGALDLLLVTEISPKEFIYGKLYGVFYNAKEMIALPVLLTLWFAISGVISAESAVFVIIDFLLLCHFSAMLGLHAAITYTNSRTAVAHSLGTIFFLLVGILICAFLIVLSDQEFGRQLLSFLIFIGAGSVALFGSLGAKNPSHAIALVALLTPFWSFYCVISLIHRDLAAAFLVSCGIYGFALLAMLVPAVSDFDIALGRTNAIQG